MEIPEDALLLRIFINETQIWRHKPLYEVIVHRAFEMNLGGATVLRGLMGYGKSGRLHTNLYLDTLVSLPMVIEIVDSDEKINAFLPVVDEMISSGLVTLEKAKVLHYRGETPAGMAKTP
jgi:PII-like signaling protein